MEWRERKDRDIHCCVNCMIKMKNQFYFDCSADQRIIRCSGCLLVTYCSLVCQAEHGPSHQRLCHVFSRKTKLPAVRRVASENEDIDEEMQREFARKRNFLLRVYWHKFGYMAQGQELRDDDDFPWQCPYQLGEISGEFQGWIDEDLSRLDSMLTTSIQASSRRWYKIPKVLNSYTELKKVFLTRRANWWYFRSQAKERCEEAAEVLFAKTLSMDKDTSHYQILDEYMRGSGFRALSFWETFLDRMGRFYNRVRMGKYSVINLDNIPEKKINGFRRIIKSSAESSEYCKENTTVKVPCLKCINCREVLCPLPSNTRCVGCDLSLDGKEGQHQLQFPLVPWLSSEPTIIVRFPASPVIHDTIGASWIVSCDKDKCLRNGVALQMLKYAREGFSFLKFLSSAEQCNGCLRHSVRTHKCSECLSARYCSNDCLARDWTNHRPVCQFLKHTQSQVLGSKERKKSTTTCQEMLKDMDPYLDHFLEEDQNNMKQRDLTLDKFLKLTDRLKIKKG